MDALGNAPEAQAEIRALVFAQARELRAREERRLGRALNRINLGLAVTLTALSAGGVYLMIRLATAPSPLQWLAIVGTVLLGLVGLILSLAAFSTVYNPPPGSNDSGAEA